jgi:hypothetical protein
LKKATKISIISALGLGVFASGFFGKDIVTKASSDWQTNAINQAQAELKGAADDKAQELSTQASTDINATVSAAVSNDLESRQAELNKLMEEYYKMKLAGLTDTQAFKDIETQIANIQEWALNQFKTQIDQAFATQTTTP